MKTIAAGSLVVASMLLVSAPSVAQSAMSSSMPSSMSSSMMPKCASGDAVVGVNMTTKMYMTQAQMKAKSAGMTAAQKEAMMSTNHVKMMCKSHAVSMGAKPMASPPM